MIPQIPAENDYRFAKHFNKSLLLAEPFTLLLTGFNSKPVF